MNSLIFLNNIWFFSKFSYVFENTSFLKKNQTYNNETLKSIAREILECNMKSCCRNIF